MQRISTTSSNKYVSPITKLNMETKKRFKNNIFTDLTDEEIKEVLIQLIIGRCARNMESDNQTIKESINSLMEQVLI